MSTYKKDEIINSSFINIYDKRKQKLKITYAALALLLLISILFPAPADYLLALQEGFRLKGIDNLYDYIVPLITSFIICYVFFYAACFSCRFACFFQIACNNIYGCY